MEIVFEKLEKRISLTSGFPLVSTELFVENPESVPAVTSEMSPAISVSSAITVRDALRNWQALFPGQDYVVWEKETPWDALDRVQAPPRRRFAALEEISLDIGRNEYESTSFVITNLAEGALPVDLSYNSTDLSITLRKGIWITDYVSGYGAHDINDALSLIDGDQVTIPYGESIEIWVTLNGNDAAAGQYTQTITVAPPYTDPWDIDISVTVHDISLPEVLPLNTYYWDYALSGPVGSYSPELLDARFTDLKNHYVNTTNFHPVNLPLFRFSGNQLITPSYTQFDERMDAYEAGLDQPVTYVFEMISNTFFEPYGPGFMTKAWKAGFSEWLTGLVDHLQSRGIGYDRYSLHPYDESLGTNMYRMSKLIKETDPNVLVLANSLSSSMAANEAIAPYIDIWMPFIYHYWEVPGRRDWLRDLVFSDSGPRPPDQSPSLLWTYANPSPSWTGITPTSANAYQHYRTAVWEAWDEGMTGFGYWIYAARGSWNYFDSQNNTPEGGYAVVYDATRPDTPPEVSHQELIVPSKRWEATREGVEDYTYLSMLRSAIDNSSLPPRSSLVLDAENTLASWVQTVVDNRDTDFAAQAKPDIIEAIIALTPRLPIISQVDIGEVGRVTNLSHEPQTIALSRQYVNPVVFAQSASTNGGDPVVVRVTDVQLDQFTMYLAESSDEDGLHGNGESVTYIVLEAGTHRLVDGIRLEVGTVATSDTVGRRINNQWESISFDSSFTSSPVVLSQIQTTDGVSYLQTRQRNITSSNFQLSLEQEESINMPHSMETVGYLAMDASSGNWNGLSYEAFATPDAVTDSWYQLSYNRFYDSPPNLLTSLTSYMGIDSSHVRYTNLLANGVQLKIDEDTTYDSEVAHNAAESVAYLAIGGQGKLTARDPGVEIGEVNKVTNLTHVPQVIVLDHVYSNPVVFAQSASTDEGDPVVVRVANVQSDQFTMYLAEPSDKDGLHNYGESVTYIVLEAGTHRLVDGTQLEVGTAGTSATVGRLLNNQWEPITFNTAFALSPVVLSQIQTTDGVSYLQTRHDDITSSGFQLALEQEEGISVPHGVETVGYLAMDAGSGAWSNMSYEAFNTPMAVTDSWYPMPYEQFYSTPPSLLSSLASYKGIDSSHVRYTNAQVGRVQLKIDEDTTYDLEVAHNAAESVAYLAIGGQGMLTALRPQVDIGEVGRVTNLTHVPQLVVLERVYSNPVVFAQSASTNGGHPVAVRVTNVQSDRFTLYLAEPSDEDGQHGRLETVSYLVLEAGTHRLGNGTQLEVSTVGTSATVGRLLNNQWEPITLNTAFSSSPVVLSQIQTTTGDSYLQTRHDDITSSGFQLALEQEEGISTRHGVETVGYLAMDVGSGEWSNMSYEAFNTPMAVTDSWYQLSYQQSYVTLPSLLTSLASYKGIDSSHVRYIDSLTGGVQLKIDEDTTYDTEVRHTAAESVAYLAIGGEGLLSALPPQLPASASSNPSIPVSALHTAFLDVSNGDLAFTEPEAGTSRDPFDADRTFISSARASAVTIRPVSKAANDRVFAALGNQHLDFEWMADTHNGNRALSGTLQQAILESWWFFGCQRRLLGRL